MTVDVQRALPWRIAAALKWVVRSVALLVLCLLMPAEGRRRKPPRRGREKSPDAVSGVCSDHVDLGARAVTLRSPYSIDRAPLDGNACALTRPYLSGLDLWLVEAPTAVRVRPYRMETEAERECAKQQWRRTALVMAADFGVDLDTRDIHAVAAGGGGL